MESSGFYLKEVLAVVRSASLLSATLPPPSPAAVDMPHVGFYGQIAAPLAATPAWTKQLSAQSATLAIGPKLRSQGESSGTSLVPGRVKPFVPEITTHNPKRTATTGADGLGAKRKRERKTRALDKQGLVFIENKGQFDTAVKFRASNHGRTLWLAFTGGTMMNNILLHSFVNSRSVTLLGSPRAVQPSSELNTKADSDAPEPVPAVSHTRVRARNASSFTLYTFLPGKFSTLCLAETSYTCGMNDLAKSWIRIFPVKFLP